MAWKPKYVSDDDLKAFLRVHDSVDDVQVDLAIEAASRAIDVACNRQFGKVDSVEERFYSARYDSTRGRWVVEVDDLMSTSGFDAQVQDSDGNDVGAIDDYVLEPRNAPQTGKPWTRLMVRPGSTYRPTGATDELAITALWGWTAYPDPVKKATLLQASRFLARRDSPYGVAGSPDLGSELRLLARLDPDVAVIVNPYRRWWGAR